MPGVGINSGIEVCHAGVRSWDGGYGSGHIAARKERDLQHFRIVCSYGSSKGRGTILNRRRWRVRRFRSRRIAVRVVLFFAAWIVPLRNVHPVEGHATTKMSV